MKTVRINSFDILSDPGVLAAVESVATEIVKDANANTSAPIGITWERRGDVVHIGPRGAAAIAVEYGSYLLPAKRPVKRALDTHQVA